jgi:RsiW-degrading membrane proteinase PrsW (M82 family)
MISAILAIGLIWLLLHPLSSRFAHAPLAYGLYEAFVLAAIPEEVARFCVLRWWLGRTSQSLSGRRCLLLGALVGLGFAAIENVGFCRHGWGTVLERSVTALPFHTLAAAIVGYYTGLSIQTRRLRWALLGVLITSGLHGINNFNWSYFFDTGPVEGMVIELPTEGLPALLITGWPSNLVTLAVALGLVFLLARRRYDFAASPAISSAPMA